MQERQGLNADQRELELAMRSVTPAAVRVDPVSAAFAAGKASSRRQVQFWQAVASIVLAAGISLHLLHIGNTTVQTTHDRPGSVLLVGQQTPPYTLPDETVLMLQRAMNARGAEGLPAPRLCPVQPLRAGDIL